VTARRLAGALAALALAAPAAAYVRSSDDRTGVELFWPMPVVPYLVSDAEPVAASPSCVAGPGGDPALDAVRTGFSAWHQGCANLDLVYGGRIPEIRTGLHGTGENLVVFRRGWCRAQLPPSEPCLLDPDVDCGGIYGCFEDESPLDRNIVALTSVLYEPDNGRIVDADIEVNGWDGQAAGTSLSSGSSGPPHGWYFTCDKQAGWNACATYGQADCYHLDLQNTVTHEVGHLVGLAHPCESGSCTPALEPLTMYPQTSPGDLEKRTLHADDVAGLCTIYPAERGGSGCASGGASGAISILLALLALRRRRPAA
jgi:hypothetical protein